MESRPLWNKLLVIAALFVAYFPIAYHFKHSYVPRPDPPPARSWIKFGPFPLFAGRGFAYVADLPEYDQFADSIDDPRRSPLVVYENEMPLGPAHSDLGDAAALGKGRYSHWRGIGLVFSSSDSSDPNTNGYRYSVTPLHKMQMKRNGPFRRYGKDGHAYVLELPAYESRADSLDGRFRSPLILYENGRPLGPAHTPHHEIAELGNGRYSHWRGLGVLFSASDNSDPNENDFAYTIGPWEDKDK